MSIGIRQKISFLIQMASIVGGGVINKAAVLGKSRAVARTIPAMLRFVILKRAPEVRASPYARGDKTEYGFNTVYEKLWVKNAP